MQDSPSATASAAASAEKPAGPRWRPLERNERRVVGVLAEKAKTTPDAYPMTVNALINGSNQKNNRFPQTQLDEGAVLDALESLRRAGAVSLIQGDGRAEKYRHLLYDWMGVDKMELAVMTELLLRGAQTLGELRGRAARMEPIRDMGELTPIVERLREKGLVIFLSSPGRGAVITHNLYQPQELTKLRNEHGNETSAPAGVRTNAASTGSPMPQPVAGPAEPNLPTRPAAVAAPAAPPSPRELDQLRSDVAELKRSFAELRDQSEIATAELRRQLDDLKQQLGV
jgi:uncharacterized protein YceH (UPF0502 family)